MVGNLAGTRRQIKLLTESHRQGMAIQELRIMIVLLVLHFRFEHIPEALNSPLGTERALRVPEQCYVRLTRL